MLTRERSELRPELPSAPGWAETRFWIGTAGLFVITVVLAFVATTFLLALVFGYRPVVVVSGSMEPTMSIGDVVLYQPGPATNAGPGTVVVFPDPKVDGGTLIHRVDTVDPATGDVQTKGDANAVADSRWLAQDDVMGVGRILVPYVGIPTAWLQTGKPLLTVAFVILMIGAAWAGRWGWYTRFDPWAEATAAEPAP